MVEMVGVMWFFKVDVVVGFWFVFLIGFGFRMYLCNVLMLEFDLEKY